MTTLQLAISLRNAERQSHTFYFITILALKYFNRLKQIPSERLLGEVNEVDKSLLMDTDLGKNLFTTLYKI